MGDLGRILGGILGGIWEASDVMERDSRMLSGRDLGCILEGSGKDFDSGRHRGRIWETSWEASRESSGSSLGHVRETVRGDRPGG